MHGFGDCRESNNCTGHGVCDNGLCRCDPGWTDANCSSELLCRYWDEEGQTWSSEGLVPSPPPGGIPDGFLHCDSVHLTDFGGIIRIPMSLDELLAELTAIKFTMFSLDDLASVLSFQFSPGDNPTVFTMVTLAFVLDLLMICCLRWRYRRRMINKHREHVKARQTKRDPEFTKKQESLRKAAVVDKMAVHARTMVALKHHETPVSALPPSVRDHVAALQLQATMRGRSVRAQQASSKGMGGLAALAMAEQQRSKEPKASTAQPQRGLLGLTRQLKEKRSTGSLRHLTQSEARRAAAASAAADAQLVLPSPSKQRGQGLAQAAMHASRVQAAAAPGAPATDASGSASALAGVFAMRQRSDRVMPNNPGSSGRRPSAQVTPPPSPPAGPPPPPAHAMSFMRPTHSSGKRDAIAAAAMTMMQQEAQAAASSKRREQRHVANCLRQSGATEAAKLVEAATAPVPNPQAAGNWKRVDLERLRAQSAAWSSSASSSATSDAFRTPAASSVGGALEERSNTPVSTSAGSAVAGGIERVENAELTEQSVRRHVRADRKERNVLVAERQKMEDRMAEERRLQDERDLDVARREQRQREAEAQRAKQAERQKQRQLEAERRQREEVQRQLEAAAAPIAELAEPEIIGGRGDAATSVTHSSESTEKSGSEMDGSSRASSASGSSRQSAPQIKSGLELLKSHMRSGSVVALAEQSKAAEGDEGPINQTILPPPTLAEPDLDRLAKWRNKTKEAAAEPHQQLRPAEIAAGNKLVARSKKSPFSKLAHSPDVREMKQYASKLFKRELSEERKRAWQEAKKKGVLSATKWILSDACSSVRSTMRVYVRALQSEHTIVSAIAPAADDTAGDHLHDENVVQIFWLTMMSEMFVLCMLRDGEEVPLLSLTTFIHGIITCVACGIVASFSKKVFRWGNKRRWRRRDPNEKRAPRRWRALLKLVCFPYFVWAWLSGKRAVRKQKRLERLAARQLSTRRLVFDPKTRQWHTVTIPEPSKSPTNAQSKLPLRLTTTLNIASRWQRTANPDEVAQRGKWITISPRVHLFRFWFAWGVVFGLFFITNFSVLAFSVSFDEASFNMLLVAWLAGLIFTWLVVEPGEVACMVLFPKFFAGRRVQACRQKCKDLGIYG